MQNFTLYARNREDRREFQTLKFSDNKAELFDFAYKHQNSFYQKGGWLIEVECNRTGQLQEDDRLDYNNPNFLA